MKRGMPTVYRIMYAIVCRKLLVSRLQMCERKPMSHFEQVNGKSCGPACSFLSYLGPACLFGMTTYSLPHLEQVNDFYLALPAHFSSYLGPACLFG